MNGLAVYETKGLPFAQDLSLENSADSYFMSSTGFTSLSVLPILVELIDLVNSVIISNDLTQMVNFLTWIPSCDSYSHAPLDFSFF